MEVLTLTFQAQDTPAHAIFAYPLLQHRFDSPLGTDGGPRRVPDPRDRRGVRHGLPMLLGLGIAAVIAGVRSFAAIGEWVADQPPGALAQLGVHDAARPEESAIRRLKRPGFRSESQQGESEHAQEVQPRTA